MNALLLDRYLAFIISIIRIVYVIGVGSDAARARFVILSTEHATVVQQMVAELRLRLSGSARVLMHRSSQGLP